MADEEAKNEAVQKSGFLGKVLVSLAIAFIAGGLGFSIPLLFPSVLGREPSASHDAKTIPVFVPFGDVVVNLNEGRLNRYLRLSITLQITASEGQEEELKKAIESNKSILQSWLLSYLADMGMEDIRGAAGQNRLRREIHDHFNYVLFPDGSGQIDDVLFQEFNVQ